VYGEFVFFSMHHEKSLRVPCLRHMSIQQGERIVSATKSLSLPTDPNSASTAIFKIPRETHTRYNMPKRPAYSSRS
jgi:hypothetical protein